MPRLLLEILPEDSEGFECPNKFCGNNGRINIYMDKPICPTCKGTRLVRLEGSVEVKQGWFNDDMKYYLAEDEDGKWFIPYAKMTARVPGIGDEHSDDIKEVVKGIVSIWHGTAHEYTELVTNAYKSGTLPESLMYHKKDNPNGLRLVDVEKK